MIVHSSSRSPWGRLLRDDRGSIIIFVALSMMVMLGATGLAVDLGRGFVERVRISRAVDAAALSAARSLRVGQSAALVEAAAVARANGVVPTVAGVSTSVAFGTNAQGENTVTVTASKPLPTVFMRVLGQTMMNVGAGATAAVPPIDLALILDQSESLIRANKFGDLQAAATTFVGYFSNTIDQMSLVSFQIRANTWVPLQGDFSALVTSQIAGLTPGGYTNMGEGLRLGGVELAGPNARPEAAKVVVFFTDGRPTAFRGLLGPPGAQQDRVGSHSQVPSGLVRGYNDNPPSIPMTGISPVDGCPDVTLCFGMSEAAFRQATTDYGLAQADILRSQGFIIYAIGLGDPTMPIWWQPNLDYLGLLANVGGIVDPAQPRGQVFFAPSVADLQMVFDQVANALLVRLAS